MHSIHIWDLYEIKFHSCFFCWLAPFGGTWKLTECSKYKVQGPNYTGKRACLMPFFVNALFCSKIRRYDCHVFIPEMIPNYAWSPLHLFFCDADLVRLDLGQMRLAHSGLWIVFISEILIKYHFKIKLSNPRI